MIRRCFFLVCVSVCCSIGAQEDVQVGFFEEEISEEAAQSGVGQEVIQEDEDNAQDSVGEEHQRVEEMQEAERQEVIDGEY